MSSVDERIVSMKIDNAQLLSGVKSSQAALASLNKSVNDTGNVQGMNKLGSAVDTVKTKFSAMQIAGVTAIATVANKAVNSGLSMIKSLTIDPIMDGYREYETKLKSIGTIMANTDAPIGKVTKALNQLNQYSDMTIYNFGEMAKNVGTFTAAGVGLKDSVSAIKGIANVAALSGSSSEQAAGAMYQLSQAIAAGKVGAQDWNSVVNAGMAGKKLQNALAQTAVAMGKLNKAQVTGVKAGEALQIKGQSFRNSIMALPGQTSWLTSDILVKSLATLDGRFSKLALSQEKNADGTLKYKNAEEIANQIRKNRNELEKQGVKFSDAQFKALKRTADNAVNSATKVKSFGQAIGVLQETVGSGFASVFENIFGNVTEATKVWTTFTNTIKGGIDVVFLKVNEILSSWKALGGYQAVWNGFGNIFQALGNLLSPIVEAFRSIVPASGDAGKGLADASKGFEAATEWLERITRSADVLTPVFRVFFEVVKIGAYIVGGLVKSALDLVGVLGSLIPDLDDVGLGTDKVIKKFADWADIGPRIGEFFDNMIAARHKVLDPIVETLQAIGNAFKLLFKGDVSGFEGAFKNAFEHLSPLGDVIDNIGNKIEELGDRFFGADSKIAGIGETIKGFGSTVETFFQGFGSGASDKVSAGIDKIGNSADAASKVGDKAGSAWDGFLKAMGAVKDAIGPIISAIGGYLDSAREKLSSFFGGVDKMSFLQTIQIVFSAASIVYITRFLNSFKGAFDSFKEIGTSVSGTFNQLTGNLQTMQNSVRAKMILNIAIAVGILAASLWVLSRIPQKQLGVAIGAVASMITLLVGSMMVLSGGGKGGAKGTALSIANMNGTASALVLLATAITILTGAVAVLGSIDQEVLKKGLISLAVMMGVLTAAGVAMGAIGPAAALGAAALGVMALTVSAALLVLSAALVAMAGTILLWEKLKFKDIAEGVGKISFMLLALGVAIAPLALLSPGVLLASVALGVLSVTLSMLLATITLFSQVSWGTLMGGVAKIVAALAGLAIAALLAPAITALAIALGALGLAIMLIGGGVALLGLGLATLAVSAVVGMTALIAAAQMFLAVLPILGIQFIAAMTTILQALASAAPKIVDSLVTIGQELLRGFVELLPDVADAAIVLIDEFLRVLEESADDIAETGVSLIQSFLDALVDGSDAIIDSIVELASDILQGFQDLLPEVGDTINALIETAVDVLIQAVEDNQQDLIDAAVDFVTTFMNGIGDNAEEVTMAAGDMILDVLQAIDLAVQTYAEPIAEEGRMIGFHLMTGLVDGLIPDRVENAIRDLAQGNIIDAFKSILGIHSPSTVFQGFGRDIVMGLINGIGNLVGNALTVVSTFGANITGRFIGFMQNLPGRVKSALSGLAGSLGGAFSRAFDAARTAVATGVSTIMSKIGELPGKIGSVVSRVAEAARGLGRAVINGIGEGIARAGDWAADIAGSIKSAINSALGLPKRIAIEVHKGPINISAGTTIPAFARGTDRFSGGMALVGELGPELVSMPGGSSVITNKNLMTFMRAITNLSRIMAKQPRSASTDREGSIVYRVAAHMSGNPKKDGLAFAGHLVGGLREGMAVGQTIVAKSSSAMGDRVKKSFAKTLEIHSPSKVFRDMGFNVTQGFVDGLMASVDRIRKVGEFMGKMAVDTVSRTVTQAQIKADALQAKADALRETSENKKFSKKQRKKLKQQADATAKQAKQAQKDADAAQKREDDRKKFEEADTQGKADILNERASSWAREAEKQRELALKLDKEADLIRKVDKKKAAELDKKAKAALKKATEAADKAQEYAQSASRYTVEVATQQTDELQDALDAARAESDLDGFGMTDEERAAYYKTVLDEQTALAQAKYAEAQALLDKARSEAASNAALAAQYNEEAQKAFEAAEAAADAANNAAQSLGQDSGSSSGSGGNPYQMPDINIASSNVYGAQNMFDAYAQALVATTDAIAGDNSTTINLVQNNTSPTALSATEIYRQTNNLLSQTERKLTSVLP